MAKIKVHTVVSAKRIDRKHSGSENAPTSKRVYPDGYFGATLRNIRIAPNKVRLVVDQIRGQHVERAREILRYSNKRAAYYLDRILLSAVGNADNNSGGTIGPDALYVHACYANEGPRLKRFLAGPQGRARPILRRMSNITVVLGPQPIEEDKAVKEPKVKSKKTKKEKAA